MKKLLLFTLLTLIVTTGTLVAADLDTEAPKPRDATAQQAVSLPPLADSHSDATTANLSNTFVKMPIHQLLTTDGATAAGARQGIQAGASCVSCTSHSQCNAVCGGFGVCLRDLGLVCGSFPFDKYCFC